MKFYKGVLKSDLKTNYVPGTVTNKFMEAFTWYERISSKKNKGASKHIRHGEAVIIEIQYDGELKDPAYFQASGVCEHKKDNCWTSADKQKAQINTPCSYRILSKNEIDNLFSY